MLSVLVAILLIARCALDTRGYTLILHKFRNATQAEDIKKQLRKELNTKDVTQLLIDAEDSRRANRARDVRAILNPLTPAMQPLNPMGLPPPEPKKR